MGQTLVVWKSSLFLANCTTFGSEMNAAGHISLNDMILRFLSDCTDNEVTEKCTAAYTNCNVSPQNGVKMMVIARK